jgi:hypothetical protein
MMELVDKSWKKEKEKEMSEMYLCHVEAFYRDG